MKTLLNRYIELEKSKEFNNGFIKAFDIFGELNEYKNIDQIKSYSYKDGFIRTGESLKKYINIEGKINDWK